ncbi:MAG TPA: thioredoxin family protein [Aquaticitalea sp.]|nr:thioredoxin family protein [Aquaticitalea sp.]
MAQTASTMLALGTKAPDFKLLDTVTGDNLGLEDCMGLKGTVIMFICNHCPFVKHVNAQLVRMAKDYKSKGINFVAISSNDVDNYPQDGPDKMNETAKNEGYIFPYLYDASQQIAKSYKAACTPDFYVFDEQLTLVYRGQLDDSRPGNGKPVDGKDIRNALNALLDKRPVNPEQKPSMGCNIKWKPEIQ